MRFIVIAAALALLVGVGCSSGSSGDVNQGAIYQDYLAQYDEQDDETFVCAQYRFGGPTGTTLQLAAPSTVEHSLYSLSPTTVFGTEYVHTEFNSGPQLAHVWTFTDTSLVVYTNGLNLTAIAFDAPPANISRAAGATIDFTPALAQDETALVHIYDPANPLGETIARAADTIGATSIVLSPVDLAALGNGTRTMELIRFYRAAVQQGTVEGGVVRGEYHTAHLAVTIDP